MWKNHYHRDASSLINIPKWTSWCCWQGPAAQDKALQDECSCIRLGLSRKEGVDWIGRGCCCCFCWRGMYLRRENPILYIYCGFLKAYFADFQTVGNLALLFIKNFTEPLNKVYLAIFRRKSGGALCVSSKKFAPSMMKGENSPSSPPDLGDNLRKSGGLCLGSSLLSSLTAPRLLLGRV